MDLYKYISLGNILFYIIFHILLTFNSRVEDIFLTFKFLSQTTSLRLKQLYVAEFFAFFFYRDIKAVSIVENDLIFVHTI